MMLPAIACLLVGFIGSFLILRSGKPQIEQRASVYYKDYVIDHDGTLVYTHKHIDIQV